MRSRPAAAALLVTGLYITAAPAPASHYADERARGGTLTEKEVRLEIRRVLRQRGFARRVSADLKQNCQRRSARRFTCQYSRDLEGSFRLRGSGTVYVLSGSANALLRYRLDTTVTISPPCEGSPHEPCVSHFRFTDANHRRVYPGG